jgi:hypothetical protein
MRVFIVAFNSDEYSNQASLHQVFEPQDKAFKEKVFTTFEKAVKYAEKWAKETQSEFNLPGAQGDPAVAIFQAEMDEEP